MADINIFALGGQDENGKNCLVIEYEKEIFVVNVGLKIPINNLNGIDGIIPSFEYLVKNKERIKGIFITHGHDEVFASIPWLIMDISGIKIYASDFTKQLIEERISKYKIGHNNFKIETIKPEQRIGSLNVKSFELANSIPGSLAYKFETVDGDIIFMSNNTLDDIKYFGKTNLEKIKEISNNVLALILDSRFSNFKGHSSDKKSVVPYVEKVFQNSKKNERIVVGAYDEEVYNIYEIIKLAKKYNRPVISYGRAFNSIFLKMRKMFDIDVPNFFDYKKINLINNAVVLITSTWSRLYQRLVRIANNDDVFMKFKENDKIIMIAPPINGMEVAYADSLDEVAKIAPDILDVSDKDLYKLRPTESDIEKIVQTFKPKYFIPISGFYRYLVVATKIAIKQGITQDRNIVLQNGKILHLKNGKLASQKFYIKEFGDVIIDGFGIGDVSYEVLKERKTLAAGGLITISLKISRKTKKLIGNINVQVLGMVIKSKLKQVQDEVKNVVIKKMEEQAVFNLRELQNTIRKKTRNLMFKKLEKEPLVVITFCEV